MSNFTQIDIAIKINKSPINVIAYSKDLHFVAVGRDNGIVELYDFSQNFLLISKIIISNTDPIDGLIFMNFRQETKLFGISSSKLFEIDLGKNYIKQEIVLNSSHCARAIISAGDKIVVGCDGGYIHIYDYFSEIKFQHTHNTGQSVLSLAHSKNFNGFLYAGSLGRIYQVELKANTSKHFNMIKEDNKTQTYVWCLEFVGKYLCSGDSKGIITIWNANPVGVLQSFQTHKADILSIATGVNFLYASGADPQLVKLEFNVDKWIETSRRYGLVGDVRSLCLADNKVIAGGLNCSMSVIESHDTHFDTIPQNDDPAPTIEMHNFTKNRQILFTEISKSIKIYEINPKSQTRTLLRTVKPANESHLQAWSASKSLKYIAYSTDKETRVLKMQFSDKPSLSVDLKRFQAAEFANTFKASGAGVSLPGSYLLKFVETHHKTYLILVESISMRNQSNNDAKLFIYEIVDEAPAPVLVTSILAKDENHFNGVHKLEVSDNGKVMAFSTFDGLLFIYSLEKLAMIKKIGRQICNPNKKDTPRVLCMKFNAKATSIVAVYSNNKVWTTVLNSKTKPKWCAQFNANIPKEWMKLSPRDVGFLDETKLVVLMNRGLLVQMNMDKPAIVPANAPLFNRVRYAKETKESTIRKEVAMLNRNVVKMNRIIGTLTEKNELDQMKSYEKRLVRYQDKIDKLMSTDIDTTIDTCLSWDFVKKGAVVIKFIRNQDTILSVSLEEPDQKEFTFKKKIFGL